MLGGWSNATKLYVTRYICENPPVIHTFNFATLAIQNLETRAATYELKIFIMLQSNVTLAFGEIFR